LFLSYELFFAGKSCSNLLSFNVSADRRETRDAVRDKIAVHLLDTLLMLLLQLLFTVSVVSLLQAQTH